jgi:hypothetical protein
MSALSGLADPLLHANGDETGGGTAHLDAFLAACADEQYGHLIHEHRDDYQRTGIPPNPDGRHRWLHTGECGATPQPLETTT